MQKKILFSIIITGTIIALGFFVTNEKPQPSLTTTTVDSHDHKPHKQDHNEEIDISLNIDQATTSTNTNTNDQQATQKAMAAQMGQIAEAYKQTMRFPKYSKPLTKQDWQMLNPRAFVATPTPIEGIPDLNVSIEVAQYINDIRKPLTVTVMASSPSPLVSSVSVSLVSEEASTNPLPLNPLGTKPKLQLFEGTLSPETLTTAGTGEMLIKAQLQLTSGQTITNAAPIELYGTAADLQYLGDTYIDGADLVIPAFFEVHNEGYFRVQANLMDAQSGDPVSHINAAFVLSKENPSGLLKVHAETLRAMQAPGPYILTDFNIIRSQSWPGDDSGYGSSQQEVFNVSGFSLEAYSDEPYINEQAQQRLDFLEGLANSGGGPN